MYKYKNEYLAKPTFQASDRGTKATFEPANRTADLVERTDHNMAWEIEYTDEFEQWWLGLDIATQEKIAFVVRLLEEKGPNLESKYSSGINGSRYGHMRELRVQVKGEPYRILYAFDPRRVAVLLFGGNKGGNDLWYEENIPIADKLYEELLKELNDEGLI